MKKIIVCVVVLVSFIVPVCSAASWSTTILGGPSNSAAASVGYMFDENKSEFGVYGVSSDLDKGGYSLAVGPYIATRTEVPYLHKIVGNDDLATFAGIGLSFPIKRNKVSTEGDGWKPVYTPFVGGILYPERQVSACVAARYNLFSGGIDDGDTNLPDGLNLYFGFRIWTK